MDNSFGTDNSVAAGIGEQLYDGRVYPYFACDCDCSGVGESHSGPKTPLARMWP